MKELVGLAIGVGVLIFGIIMSVRDGSQKRDEINSIRERIARLEVKVEKLEEKWKCGPGF